MANTLKLEIVTPDAKTYSEDVEMVTLPGVEGEMGIYPNHVPLMTQIAAGEVIVRKDGRDSFLAVGDGFVEITGDHVSILSDMAIKAENIDEAAQRPRKGGYVAPRPASSKNLMTNKPPFVNAALAHSLAQLKVKRRTHS